MATSSFDKKFTLRTKKAAETLLALMEHPQTVQLSHRDEEKEKKNATALLSTLLERSRKKSPS